jgi:hypothetical protein
MEREALIRGLSSIRDMLQIMEATGGVSTAKGERPSQTISAAMQMLDLLGTRCEGRETEIDVLGELLARLAQEQALLLSPLSSIKEVGK